MFVNLVEVIGKMADNGTKGVRSLLAAGCDFFYFCDLCVQGGEHIEAFGYCMDCQDYLCRECFHKHLRPKSARSHVLLDQHQMPKDQQQMPKDLQQYIPTNACTEACATHPHKTVEYFCSEHGELGCSVCMTLNHRTCKQVDHIPDIASDILSSTEYSNLQGKITALTNQTNSNIQTSRDQIKRAQTYHANVIEDLKQVITDIRAAADEIESTVVREVDQMETEDIQRLQLFEDTCKMTLENMEAMSSMLTGLQNRGQQCQMLIALKRATQDIGSIETRVSEHGQVLEAVNYRLVTSREAHAFLDAPESMFRLELFQETHARACLTQSARSATQCRNEATVVPKQHKTPAARQRNATVCVLSFKATIISAAVLLLAIILAGVFYERAAPVHHGRDTWVKRGEHVLDINVKSTDDSETRYIAGRQSRDSWETRAEYVMDINVRTTKDIIPLLIPGSVVLPGEKIVLVDRYNNKLKLIDLTHNTLLSQLVLQGALWDITMVTSTQVAVTTLSIQTIYFVNVSDKLKLESEVKVKGECRGIASIDDKLVVSYVQPVKVEIISLTGQVLHTVIADKGNMLFTKPLYVAVSRDQQTINISDLDRNTVTSVDLTGHVQATYKSDKLRRPYGLTVDSTGAVYVCGVYSHNILQLTADLTEIQQLLQKSDGVVDPYSVSYCETTDRLYVGMYDSDVIKVYQLK